MTSVTTDLQLLEKWRAGDEAAGSQLVSTYVRSLYGFFYNKLDQDVEDLVQRVFLRCVESIDRFRADGSFRTYLFAIARNELYGYYRRRQRDLERLDFDTVSIADLGAASPSQVMAENEEHRLLLRALRQLPVDLQIALELYFWENMRGPEIARVLEIPEGTVRTRIRRARQLLGEHMSALAADPAALKTTLDNLDRWARSLRVALPKGE